MYDENLRIQQGKERFKRFRDGGANLTKTERNEIGAFSGISVTNMYLYDTGLIKSSGKSLDERWNDVFPELAAGTDRARAQFFPIPSFVEAKPVYLHDI